MSFARESLYLFRNVPGQDFQGGEIAVREKIP